MKTKQTLLTALALTLPLAGVKAQPQVPGTVTVIYATVTDPLSLSFGADGALYVGRDNSGSGGGNPDAVRIHRAGPGGSPVAEYGNAAIPDPDAVIVDRMGTISGIAGAVLVGGQTSPGTGAVWRIAPDGAVTTLFGPSSLYNNTCGFAFDSRGRLLFTDGAQGRVYRTDGGAPVWLFNLSDAYFIASDAVDRIVVSPANNPGRLVLYSASGVLTNANFATVRMASPVARGPGGFWTTDLYAITQSGNLIRIALDGTTTTMGSGFSTIEALTFGPEGALYASDFNGDCIWRIQPVPPGLVSWWPGQNSAADIIGPNHAYPSNSVSYAPGLGGMAFRLSGGFFQAPRTPSLYFSWGETALTAECWVYNETHYLPFHICGMRYDDEESKWQIGYDWSKPEMIPPLDRWSHVALTIETNLMVVYLNGAPVWVVPNPQWGAGPNTNCTLRIGTAANWAPFIGLIDEFRYYNRALSSNEIAAIFAQHASATLPPPTLTLVYQGTNSVVTWPSIPDFMYQLKTSIDLGTWNNFGVPITGTSGVLTNIIPVGTDGVRFFKLLVQPN